LGKEGQGLAPGLPSLNAKIDRPRVRHFGLWLRITGDLPKGNEIKVLVTIALKA
jgi:hypothetical protein